MRVPVTTGPSSAADRGAAAESSAGRAGLAEVRPLRAEATHREPANAVERTVSTSVPGTRTKAARKPEARPAPVSDEAPAQAPRLVPRDGSPRPFATPELEGAEAAARGFADACRWIVRVAVRDEMALLKSELLLALRGSRPEAAPARGDSARLLSAAEVAERVGATPATVREWIKGGYLPAVALGPAGRKYGIRWADVEASFARRTAQSKGMDTDEAASQIVSAARSRAARRRGA